MTKIVDETKRELFSDTNATDESQSNIDASDTTITSEQGTKLSAAEEQKLKQIDAWKLKIEQNPSERNNVPAWILAHLHDEPSTPKKDAPNMDAIEARVAAKVMADLERKTKAQAEDDAFNALHSDLQVMNLSPTQKAKIQGIYTELMEEGVSPSKSLRLAINTSGVKSATDNTRKRRDSMTIKHANTVASSAIYTPKNEEDLARMTPANRKAYLRSISG